MEKHTNIYIALEDISLNANDGDSIVAKYILENIDNLENIQMKIISNACFISTTTINRFCIRLKVSGFKELKVLMLKHRNLYKKISDTKPLVNSEFRDKIKNIVFKTFDYNKEKIQKISLILKDANKINIITSHHHKSIVDIFRNKLMVMGKSVNVFDTLELIGVGIKQEADITFLITYSGDRGWVNNLEIKRLSKNVVLVSGAEYLENNNSIFLKLFGSHNQKDLTFLHKTSDYSLMIVFDFIINETQLKKGKTLR